MHGNQSHGQGKDGKQTSEYQTWSSMKRRCNNPNDKDYPDYGGRGIIYCVSWERFENFYNDMGLRPKGRSLDREDNNKGYSKSNCRWVTQTQQHVNRRVTVKLNYDGKTKTLKEWAIITDISVNVLRTRYYAGWTHKRCLTQKVRIKL